MPDKRKFYINTKGSSVLNNMLARELPRENACREKLCSDGKKRGVWECSSGEFLENFFEQVKGEVSRHQFEVYVRYAPDEWLELWPYDDTVPRPQASRKNRHHFRTCDASQKAKREGSNKEKHDLCGR